MARTETKVLTAHVPLPLAEKVDQMAERLERSRGWIMKQALSAWLDQEEERERLTTKPSPTWTQAGSSIIKPCRRGPTVRAPERIVEISWASEAT